MKLTVHVQEKAYDIHINQEIMKNIETYLDVNQRTFLIYDHQVFSHLPQITSKLKNVNTFSVPSGEESKSLLMYQKIMEKLLQLEYEKTDVIIAFGGGVVGDLAGFVAATYKRGMRFINIPTTVLSMVDSSIGGKVALHQNYYKNVIGTFYQPELVLIDISLLSTLSKRHINNGFMEALKVGLLDDIILYQIFLKNEQEKKLEEVIYRSLLVKKKIIEKDVFDKDIRNILNFGHTIGHALESCGSFQELLHGEAVAIGMLPMIENIKVKKEVMQILRTLEIPMKPNVSMDQLMHYIRNDKKRKDDYIRIVVLEDIAKAKLQLISLEALKEKLKGGVEWDPCLEHILK